MLGDAYISDDPEIPEWSPAVCEALNGHSTDMSWDGPETLLLGYSSSLHDNTKATRDNEE